MYDAVLFDLLSALLDSWSLWNDVAGGADAGRRWRLRYLEITYAAGAYVPYETLVARSAVDTGLGPDPAAALVERWDELRAWPGASEVVGALSLRVPVGVLTNCSVDLGRRAAARVGTSFSHVLTAEEVGVYKPLPEPYLDALAGLGTSPGRTLFVAGSPGDIGGAGGVGMTVVWHNPLGLALPDGAARPWRTVGSLAGLTTLV